MQNELELLPFQRRFLKGALAPGVNIAALSMPRGNGKTTLAAWLAAMVMDPDGGMFTPGTESVLVAGSIEQARITFRVMRGFLGENGGHKYTDSGQRISVNHTATNTRLRIIGSNGGAAMGLLNCPWAICDEPGVWFTNSLVWPALTTARGKPGSPLRILVVGTLSPNAERAGHWYFDLIDAGSTGSTYVMALRGNPAKWTNASEIRRVNPVMWRFPESRKELLDERDAARADSSKRADFVSYHLNSPTGSDQQMLLTEADLELTLGRAVPERVGQPVIGVDMGENRAWCAATAMWKNGRVEAVAVCPGIPDIQAMEKQDYVPKGTYTRLVDSGKLVIADGYRVPPASMIADLIRSEWGRPVKTLCDRARFYQLEDCSRGLKLEPRVTRYFEASADIRALRKFAKNGPLSIDRTSRLLLTASIHAARVENDTSGNTRMLKRPNNVGRDDVAAAAVLAAGEIERILAKPPPSFTVSVVH